MDVEQMKRNQAWLGFMSRCTDPVLRQRLEEELERLTKVRKLGLAFEDYLSVLTLLFWGWSASSASFSTGSAVISDRQAEAYG